MREKKKKGWQDAGWREDEIKKKSDEEEIRQKRKKGMHIGNGEKKKMNYERNQRKKR